MLRILIVGACVLFLARPSHADNNDVLESKAKGAYGKIDNGSVTEQACKKPATVQLGSYLLQVPRKHIFLERGGKMVRDRCQDSLRSPVQADLLSTFTYVSVPEYEHELYVQLGFRLLPRKYSRRADSVAESMKQEGKILKELPRSEDFYVYKNVHFISDSKILSEPDGRPLVFSCDLKHKPFRCKTDFFWKSDVIVEIRAVNHLDPRIKKKEGRDQSMEIWLGIYPEILKQLSSFEVKSH